MKGLSQRHPVRVAERDATQAVEVVARRQAGGRTRRCCVSQARSPAAGFLWEVGVRKRWEGGRAGRREQLSQSLKGPKALGTLCAGQNPGTVFVLCLTHCLRD